MKRVLLIAAVSIAAISLSGCISIGAKGPTTSSSGGIDPITMQGIEASNRATEEAAQRQAQQAIDQANLNTIQQANQQAADAAAAASAAAAAAAAANQ